MRIKFLLIITFSFYFSYSQNINLNESHIISNLRTSQLLGKISSKISFTKYPINIKVIEDESTINIFNKDEYSPEILNFFKGKGSIKLLPIDFNTEFNSHHPYNRNNGSMIPNRGYQQIISFGFNFKIGPLDIQFKPEHLFSENKDFEGFGEGPNGHYPVIWAKRYRLWNHIDMPERFGEDQHNEFLIGQSSIRLNFKNLSLGLSNENIWWGPSIRNSIMMSNHARGFKHITFNTIKPIITKIGNFEWQIVSGKLESSGYNPPRTDMEYAGTKLYIPKINQRSRTDDWRYMQGISFTYSPNIINGMSLGFIRWVQMYSELVKGKYTWMKGNPTWFPIFNNLFRKNDVYEDYEAQTDQALGFFMRWLWKDSNAEIYAEYYHNDSKQNIRDLLLDSDHSRAVTIGIQKVFKINKYDFLFSWEWTQLEQTAGRLLRNAGSWYEHGWSYDGYTNRGEVLGAGIGPGSNSHYFSINRIKNDEKIGIAFEIIDQDNDFYHDAFKSAKDPRRYWKDFNFHFILEKKIKNFWVSSNLVYSRSLNYMWDLDDLATPYHHPGNDVNNFHKSLKIVYMIPFMK